MQKLSQLPIVGKCVALAESPVTVRAYLKNSGERGELARAIGESPRGALEDRRMHTERPSGLGLRNITARDQTEEAA